MSHSKHTPGPWGVEETKTDLWVGPLRVDGKVDQIVVKLDIDGYTMAYVENTIANAKLISAAPEMYAALKEMITTGNTTIGQVLNIIHKIES